MKIVLKPKEAVRFLSGSEEGFALDCDGISFLLFEDSSGDQYPMVMSSDSKVQEFDEMQAKLVRENSQAVKGGFFKAIGTAGFVEQFVHWSKGKNWELRNAVLRTGPFEVVYDSKQKKLRVSKERSLVEAETKSFERNRKIKVMIVDDSATIRNILSQVVSADPELEVVALAERPSQVEELIKTHRPDVMTLDIHMPEMSGVELLKKIMPLYAIPTIMISSISKEEGPEVLEALSLGAVDYIQKPSLGDLEHVAKGMRESIKTAAKAKIRPRFAHHTSDDSRSEFARKDFVIAIGSSTGGTEALKVLFECFPKNIPPVVCVQHIPAVFSKALADRLNELNPFEVREARDGDELKENLVLIAPGGKQMAIVERDRKLRVSITDDEPVNRHKPSVDYMYDSLSKIPSANIMAVILTGMGNDGAKGMKKLRDLGHRTIAQDQETCVVYGMPREAVLLGAAEHEIGLHKIAEKLVQLSADKKSRIAG